MGKHIAKLVNPVEIRLQCLENIVWGWDDKLKFFPLKSFLFKASPHKGFEIAILQDKRHITSVTKTFFIFRLKLQLILVNLQFFNFDSNLFQEWILKLLFSKS